MNPGTLLAGAACTMVTSVIGCRAEIGLRTF
jgi:hypothetical protein